jgi:hypothetical protein
MGVRDGHPVVIAVATMTTKCNIVHDLVSIDRSGYSSRNSGAGNSTKTWICRPKTGTE